VRSRTGWAHRASAAKVFFSKTCSEGEICINSAIPKCLTDNGGPLCGENTIAPISCNPGQECKIVINFPRCVAPGSVVCGVTVCNPTQTCTEIPDGNYTGCKSPGDVACGNFTWCRPQDTCYDTPSLKACFSNQTSHETVIAGAGTDAGSISNNPLGGGTVIAGAGTDSGSISNNPLGRGTNSGSISNNPLILVTLLCLLFFV
jgi:hypothetical protein